MSFGNLKDTDASWWRVLFGKLLERTFVMPIAGQKPPRFFQGDLDFFLLCFKLFVYSFHDFSQNPGFRRNLIGKYRVNLYPIFFGALSETRCV
jgi:hypothetical protein